jgi:hypothetical protein
MLCEFNVRFDEGECSRSSAVERLVITFELSGAVRDNKKGVVGRKKCEMAREHQMLAFSPLICQTTVSRGKRPL